MSNDNPYMVTCQHCAGGGTRRAARQHWSACREFARECEIICGKRWEEVGRE